MALTLGLIGLTAFLWSLKSGQYDDVEGAALRVLADDDLDQSLKSNAPSILINVPLANAGRAVRKLT
jgi:cbb3-type cytochrome oxidase maturation protein